ncbi:T9SS type A sorting domain-containing protein [Polluticoccus soli]|uniref:T9SS type A sorting domain-containing protein n=1 Tax=Polluticoccus soli TaxID=3034150 RepID=UPI0023E1D05C|nr:T9SS type A sorting domain-containing protein [Flavipsychrobacter sp. JY13-12]
MKRSLLLSLLMLVCTAAFAQPPHYWNATYVTPTETWPFNANNQKVQILYLPGQFTLATPAPNGLITSFWVRASGNATNTLIEDLEIRMGQMTGNAFSPTTTFVTTPPMQIVRAAADLSIPTVSSNTWVEIPLDAAGFTYDNTKSLIVEISQTAVTNGFLTSFANVTTSRGIFATTGSSTGTATALRIPVGGLTVKFPCAPPSNFSASNITPTTADLSWSNQYPNVKEYEIVIDQSPLDPPNTGYQTVNPPLHIDTLVPNTCYYVHLRTNCTFGAIPDSFAQTWLLDSFCTMPVCEIPPVTIDVNKITSTTALVSWTAVPNVTKYEYAVSIDPQSPPQKGTFTTYTQVVLKGLHSNLPYFFYLRAYCSLGEPVSPWGEVQFHTAMTTGVDDLNSGDFAIDAYPNPAGNTVTILTVGRSNNAKVTIVDMTGKLVKTTSVTEDRTVVSLEGLTPGLYFVRYTDETRSEVIKLTKQ